MTAASSVQKMTSKPAKLQLSVNAGAGRPVIAREDRQSAVRREVRVDCRHQTRRVLDERVLGVRVERSSCPCSPSSTSTGS